MGRVDPPAQQTGQRRGSWLRKGRNRASGGLALGVGVLRLGGCVERLDGETECHQVADLAPGRQVQGLRRSRAKPFDLGAQLGEELARDVVEQLLTLLEVDPVAAEGWRR